MHETGPAIYETGRASEPGQPHRLAYPMRIVSPVAQLSRRSMVRVRERLAPVRDACDLGTMAALGAIIATIILELTLVMPPWLATLTVALVFIVLARLVAHRAQRKAPCDAAEQPLTRNLTSSRNFWV